MQTEWVLDGPKFINIGAKRGPKGTLKGTKREPKRAKMWTICLWGKSLSFNILRLHIGSHASPKFGPKSFQNAVQKALKNEGRKFM